jgi:hypothetical protein
MDEKKAKLKAGEELVEKLEKSLDAMKQNIKEGKEWSATGFAQTFSHYLTKYSLDAEFKTLDGDWKPFANVKWLHSHSSYYEGSSARDEIAISYDEIHEDGSKSTFSIEICHAWHADGKFHYKPDPDRTSRVRIWTTPYVGPWRSLTRLLPMENTEAFVKLLFGVIIHTSRAKARLDHDHVKQAIKLAIEKYLKDAE